VEIQPGSHRINTLNLKQYIKQYGVRDLMVWLELSVNGKSVSPNLVTFARPKHLELRPPDIKSDFSVKKDSVIVTLTAQAPALWTWLELDGMDARFSDNFFHLLPDKPVSITIATDKPLSVTEIRKNLRIRSLIDTYR
jgi:beta-mannosidase